MRPGLAVETEEGADVATWRGKTGFETENDGGRSEKNDYDQDGLVFFFLRLEIGPRCTGTRNRDPGSKRDQKFWCRRLDRKS